MMSTADEINAILNESKPAIITNNTKTILDIINEYVEDDLLEIFGDSGTGKTKLAIEIARLAVLKKKRVIYIDTERNLRKVGDKGKFKGMSYKYTPILDEVDEIVQKLPAGDLVVIDSIGLPVLGTYARMKMNERGNVLLQIIAIFWDLKKWAYKNNGLVIITNQPVSGFNKTEEDLDPFGDKSQYAAKEIWKTSYVDKKPDRTRISLTAHRSRSMGCGKLISNITITENKIDIVIK
jgi:hypothetical protein